MDKNKKIYIYILVQGISMILFGVLTLIESYETINEETEYLFIALVLISTVVSILLGIFAYSFLKRQVKEMDPTTNTKKTLKPRYIIYYLVFNLIVLFRLYTLVIT